jgi:hypothetical protein
MADAGGKQRARHERLQIRQIIDMDLCRRVTL